MPIIIGVFIIGFIFWIFAIIFELIENFLIVTEPFWFFLWNNIFIILSLISFCAAGWIFIYYKSHPAQKHFLSYKTGKITRHQAIEKIGSTFYNFKKEGIPSFVKTKILTKRLEYLQKRVRMENDFMEDLIRYIKTKSRLE